MSANHQALFAQSEPTASRRVVIFKLVDRTDNLTPETGVVLTGAEIQVSKNGAAFANAAGTVTELAGGYYSYEFTTGELDTLGNVRLKIDDAAAAILVEEYEVRSPQQVYDDIYGGAVWIAPVASGGVAGAVVGVNGTRASPTTTLADAKTLADALGYKHYRIRGAFAGTISAAHDDWLFEGVNDGEQQAVLTIGAAVSVTRSRFVNLFVTGDAGSDALVLDRCGVFDLVNVNGIRMRECRLYQFAGAPVTMQDVAGNNGLILDDCSFVPSIFSFDGYAEIAMTTTNESDVAAHRCSGRVRIKDSGNASNVIKVEMVAGHVAVDSTVTAGSVELSGDFEMAPGFWGAGSGVFANLLGWSRAIEGYEWEDEIAVFVVTGGATVGITFGVHGKSGNPVGDIAAIGVLQTQMQDRGFALERAVVTSGFAIGSVGGLAEIEYVGQLNEKASIIDITGAILTNNQFRNLTVLSDPDDPPSGSAAFVDCALDGTGSTYAGGFGLPGTALVRGGSPTGRLIPPSVKGAAVLDIENVRQLGAGPVFGHDDDREPPWLTIDWRGLPLLVSVKSSALKVALRNFPSRAEFLDCLPGSEIDVDQSATSGTPPRAIFAAGHLIIRDQEGPATGFVIDTQGLVPPAQHDLLREYALTFFGRAAINMHEAAYAVAPSSLGYAAPWRWLVLWARTPGVAGNSITVAVVNDGEPLGVRVEEVGTAVTIHHDGNQTVAAVAAAINASSTLLEVKSFVVVAGAPVSDFPATALVGGAAGATDATTLYVTDSLPSWLNGHRIVVFNSLTGLTEERVIETSTRDPGVSIAPTTFSWSNTRGRTRLVLESPLSFTPRYGDRCAIRLSPDEWPFENVREDNTVFSGGTIPVLTAARWRKFATAADLEASTPGAPTNEDAIKTVDVSAVAGATPGTFDNFKAKKQ